MQREQLRYLTSSGIDRALAHPFLAGLSVEQVTVLQAWKYAIDKDDGKILDAVLPYCLSTPWKIEGECMLSDTSKATLTAAGIDWQALLIKVGPVLAHVVILLLQQFLADKPPPSPAPLQAKAGDKDCLPDCCAEALDGQMDDLVAALVANAHLRSCCPAPCSLPTP